MPTTVLAVTTAEQDIPANATRTVLTIQNCDVGADLVYVSDQKGDVANTGIRLSAQGGYITLRKAYGEEPEKSWTIIASAAATPVRYMELFGCPTTIVEHGNGKPDPQEPNHPLDAPDMRRIR